MNIMKAIQKSYMQILNTINSVAPLKSSICQTIFSRLIKCIIIYLKNLPIRYHWNDRAISWSDPDEAFQPIAKARVINVYVILSFVSAAVPRSVAICPTGMKGKHWDECCLEMGFSCVIYDLI